MYDPEDNDITPNSDGSHDDGAISPGEQAAFDQIEAGERDLASQENNTSTSDGQNTKTSKDEDNLKDKADDTLGAGYTKGEKKKGLRGRFTRKRAMIAGGGAGIVISGGIFASVFIAGPFQVFQFANLLQSFHIAPNDSVSEGRLTNFYRYLRFPNNVEQRRIGTIARKTVGGLEANLKQRGLTPEWGTTGIEKGRLKSLRVNSADLPALRSAGLGADIKLVDGVYRINIDSPGTSAKAARANLKNVKKVLRSLDVKVGAIGMRQLKTKAGVKFLDVSVRHTIQNIRFNIAERARAKAEARGDYENSRNATIKDPDLDTSDGKTGTKDADGPESSKAKKAVKAKALKAASGIAVVGLVCAAYQIADSASTVRKANVIMPLMRVGMRTVTIASQTAYAMAGNVAGGEPAVSLDGLGFFIEDMYDATADVGARSWTQAASIQANLGQPVTGVDIPKSSHPTNSGNFIIALFNNIPRVASSSIGTICDAVSSRLGQGIGYVVDFLSGGVSALVKGVATELLLAQFTDDIVALLAGEEIDTSDLTGAYMGAYSDYGTMLSAREDMIGSGGRKLSGEEVAQLSEYFGEEKQLDIDGQGIFERYFALSNPESLLAKTAFSASLKLHPGTFSSQISDAPSTIFGSFGKTISSAFVNKTYAATAATFSYGVNSYGFSVAELENPDYQNPIENEDAVAPYIQDYKDKIATCFGVDLQSDGSLVPIEDAVRVVDKDRDQASCDDTGTDWTRIRFYIMDEKVASSFACFEGVDDQSCDNLGFTQNANTGGNSTTSLTAPGLNGYAIPCGGLPTPVVRVNDPSSTRSDWESLPSSGEIGTGSDGTPIKVFIRESCPGAVNPRTILIVSSIHGSENGGQLVGHELLFNRTDIPEDVRIIVIPELNKHGILARHNGTGTARLNANGVNLNRNFDYRWSEMDGLSDHTTPGARNYRGESPASEPESQAMINFIQALGDIDLSIHYHDNLFYVAPSGNASAIQFAQAYANGSGMHGQCPGEGANPSTANCQIRGVFQKGSLDGWQAQATGKPVLLVELGALQSEPIIKNNVDAIVEMLGNPGLW